VVSLINIPGGGSSLVYYSEIVSPKESRITINSLVKMKIEENISTFDNLTLNLDCNGINRLKIDLSDMNFKGNSVFFKTIAGVSLIDVDSTQSVFNNDIRINNTISFIVS
jgi:hypothetical protein